MGKNLTILISGLVTAGIITTLVLPGRNTAAVAASGGNAISNVFGTVISGKATPVAVPASK